MVTLDLSSNLSLVILIMLLLAYLFSVGARFLGLPRVIGQIMAGFVLGLPIIQPHLFTLENSPFFASLAELGVLLLFFFTGLEINVSSFRKNAKESLSISFFNTSLCLAGGYILSYYYFHFSPIVSLLIGISLSVSSQAIALDILEETRLLRTKVGNLILSTGAIDDLFELFLISILLILFQVSVVKTTLGAFFLQIIGFLLVILIFKWWFIPFALRVFEQEKSRSYLFMGAFIIVLLMASLSELLKVGSLIGAFIAGMLIRYTLLSGKTRRVWEEHELARSVHTISFGFMIPLFFVWVGVNTQIAAIFAQTQLVIQYILPLVLVDIGGTLIGTIIGVLFIGGTWKEGYTLGWGVIPKGDTELILATLALNGGLIDKKIFTYIVVVAFVVTIIAPIMFKYSLRKLKTKA